MLTCNLHVRAFHIRGLVLSLLSPSSSIIIIFHNCCCKCRWWVWVWSIFTCHLKCCCIWRNCRSSGTMCKTSKMVSFDQVGCTSIGQVVQLLENKGLFVEVFISAGFVRHHKWQNMGAFHQRVFGMTTTAVLVEFFSTGWKEINEYLNKLEMWKCTLLVSIGWTMEREEGGAWMIQSCKNLQSNRVSLAVPLCPLPLYLVLHLVCPRNAIFSSQNKSTASHRCFVCKQFCLSNLTSRQLCALARMDWYGSQFLLKMWVS